MAGRQAGNGRRVRPFDASDDDLSVDDWMAGRNTQIARRSGADRAGRQAWVDAIRTGQDVKAAQPGDLGAIGMQALSGQLARTNISHGYNPDEPRDDRGRWTTGGGASSAGTGGNGQHPSAGLLGALFPWAVPAAGGRTLKSAMVTAPTNPRVGPDPQRTDVFQRGPDGKLHPVEGWHTTGPFDVGTWAGEVDPHGISQDLEHIIDSVLDIEGAKAAGEAFVDALGPGMKRAIERGIFGPGHGHHPIPKFMGGAADQGLADMAPPMHREFHKELGRELRKAGSPPIGGRNGSTGDWEEMLDSDRAKRARAIGILRRATRDFDVARGTSITPHLDRELGSAEPGAPQPPK